MKNQERFAVLLSKYCASQAIVTGGWAALGKKRIQVSIHALGGPRSKKLAQFCKEVKRLEKELRKAFRGRKVEVHIWASKRKKSFGQKVIRPFPGKNITIISAPINF